MLKTIRSQFFCFNSCVAAANAGNLSFADTGERVGYVRFVPISRHQRAHPTGPLRANVGLKLLLADRLIVRARLC
jgi:hypothetical protein